MEPPALYAAVGHHRIAYDVRGNGDRTAVLIPGLLMPRRMHARLADALADSGFRVIAMEPLGFGESDRPAGDRHYSMPIYARQVVALLDELELDRTVLFGTSAGANIALATATYAPERLCGMVVESPVLERAMPTCAALAGPWLALATYGAPAARAISVAAQRIPRTRGSIPDLLLSWIGQDQRRSAEAVRGIVLGGVLVPRDVRRAIDTKALVIGHRFDPVHPIADDRALAAELVDGRFLRARSITELRRNPPRLAPAIAEFLAECWTSVPSSPVATATSAKG
ncbi:alpha/beta fold hydrolase [Nocardia sp. NPDC052566]|uniref:alpha/beta fold hydrolase n=1 Tax=Nocardia sp. NPDC052566 TaxID=3364330 RepID=UPI0037C500E4